MGPVGIKTPDMVVFHEGAMGASLEVHNLNQGGIAYITTDADLTIAWWNPVTKTYGATEAIVAPGDEVSCPSYRARFTTASTANIRIVAGA